MLPDFKQLRLGRIVVNGKLLGSIIDTKSPLAGYHFAITGKLWYLKNRNQLAKLIEAFGGVVDQSVKESTHYLVINHDAWSNKEKDAVRMGLHYISEEELYNLMGYTHKDIPALIDRFGL